MTVDSAGWAFNHSASSDFIGKGFTGRPCRALAQDADGGLRAILGFADYADEIAVAHDGNQAGNGARTMLRHVDEFGGGEFRPQHAAMQHPRQRGVVNETRMRENLVGDIQPLDGISGHRALCRPLGDRTRCRLTLQGDLAGKFPVTGPDIAGSRDDAIADDERVGPDTQPI